MYAYEKPKTLEDKRRDPISVEERTAPANAFDRLSQSAAQFKFGGEDTKAHHDKLIQRIKSQRNKTGLSDYLKNGIENLSGFSMGDVRVHYNSPKPAQLNAHAYTQNTEIHVAPGQEKHLPHEAWHVVQQMQRRVKPTLRMNGTNVNDDPSLEREETVPRAKANSFSDTVQLSWKPPKNMPSIQEEFHIKNALVQKTEKFTVHFINNPEWCKKYIQFIADNPFCGAFTATTGERYCHKTGGGYLKKTPKGGENELGKPFWQVIKQNQNDIYIKIIGLYEHNGDISYTRIVGEDAPRSIKIDVNK